MAEATCEIRVRYGETDQMRVAYYAHYLNWFEVGRSNLLRESGVSYREVESQGVFHVAVDQRGKPMRLPERLARLVR